MASVRKVQTKAGPQVAHGADDGPVSPDTGSDD